MEKNPAHFYIVYDNGSLSINGRRWWKRRKIAWNLSANNILLSVLLLGCCVDYTKGKKSIKSWRLREDKKNRTEKMNRNNNRMYPKSSTFYDKTNIVISNYTNMWMHTRGANFKVDRKGENDDDLLSMKGSDNTLLLFFRSSASTVKNCLNLLAKEKK